MKLRNKKSGEIVDFKIHKFAGLNDEGNSLYEPFNGSIKEWEDYEEPKEIYFISNNGQIHEEDGHDRYREARKEIGNYFETKEEAKKAVEKLKAWKRLKDKGFRFVLAPGVGALDVVPGKFQIDINADMPEKWFCCDAVQKELDLLFGGEE